MSVTTMYCFALLSVSVAQITTSRQRTPTTLLQVIDNCPHSGCPTVTGSAPVLHLSTSDQMSCFHANAPQRTAVRGI